MTGALAFGAPAALWALLGAVPLVALYYFRRRSSPRVVSALFLWRATAQTSESGPTVQRLQRELSLFLELLALVAATAFLADARCDGGQATTRHAVVVVDGSLSMGARTGDGTVTDRARAAVREWLGDRATTVTLLESGDRTTMLAGPAAPRADALAAIAKWNPAGPAHPLDATLRLARELAGTGTQVLLVTDAVPAGLPDEVEVRAVGAAGNNTAFVHAAREDRLGKALIELRIARFGGPGETTVPLRVTSANGDLLHSADVRVRDGSAAVVKLELPSTGDVVASIPPDALPSDDAVTLARDDRRPLRVATRFTPGSIEERTVARTVAAFPDIVVEPPPDVVFAEPGAPLQDVRAVRIGLAASAVTGAVAGGGLRSFVGPFFVEKHHPLVDDVVFDGLVWTAGPAPAGRPLVTAGTHVLVSEEADGTIHFNIDLTRSNVHRSPAWPVLVGNALDEVRRTLPGFSRRNVLLGEELSVVVGAGLDGVQRVGPDGVRRLSAGRTTETARRPGEVLLVVADADAPLDRARVLPIDARESDLRDRTTDRRLAKGSLRRDGTALRDRDPLPLLVALLALLANYLLAVPGVRRGLATATPSPGAGR